MQPLQSEAAAAFEGGRAASLAGHKGGPALLIMLVNVRHAYDHNTIVLAADFTVVFWKFGSSSTR